MLFPVSTQKHALRGDTGKRGILLGRWCVSLLHLPPSPSLYLCESRGGHRDTPLVVSLTRELSVCGPHDKKNIFFGGRTLREAKIGGKPRSLSLPRSFASVTKHPVEGVGLLHAMTSHGARVRACVSSLATNFLLSQRAFYVARAVYRPTHSFRSWREEGATVGTNLFLG